MRSFVVLMVLSVAVSGGGAALAQSELATAEGADGAAPQERPEEVIVRGRRLTELRVEVELARERAYDIFNEINTDDDFDVRCRKESRPGTNVPAKTCRAQFENRISRAAAQEYLSTLLFTCPGGAGLTQDCMFSNYGQSAISRAQGVESEALSKRHQLNDEILRLANEDERFAQAIIDWYEVNQQYEAARKRRDD